MPQRPNSRNVDRRRRTLGLTSQRRPLHQPELAKQERIEMDPKLQGKTVLVAGATRGVGFEIARSASRIERASRLLLMTASLIGHLGQALCDGRWPDRSRGSRFSSQSIGSSRRSRCTHAWDQGLESLAYGRAQSAAVIVGFIHPVVRMGRSGQDRLRWLCQIMQRPPIRTGTRCHRSTYDAVRRQSCVRQQRWLAAVLWSSSAARPMLSSCSRQSSA
jgi:hypothetical protein